MGVGGNISGVYLSSLISIKAFTCIQSPSIIQRRIMQFLLLLRSSKPDVSAPSPDRPRIFVSQMENATTYLSVPWLHY